MFDARLNPAIERLNIASERVPENQTKAIFILGLQSGSPLIGGMGTSANLSLIHI